MPRMTMTTRSSTSVKPSSAAGRSEVCVDTMVVSGWKLSFRPGYRHSPVMGETSIRVIRTIWPRPGHPALSADDTRKGEIALDGRLGVAPGLSYVLDERAERSRWRRSKCGTAAEGES